MQLGLRGDILQRYGTEQLLGIEDITPFVCEQREHLSAGFSELQTPIEHIYQPSTEAAALAVGIDR